GRRSQYDVQNMEQHAAEDEDASRDQYHRGRKRGRTAGESCLRDAELARERRERRSAGDRERADDEPEGGNRRDLEGAAHPSETEGPVALAERARRDEQRGLRERMIEHVERSREETEWSADPDGKRDDAHVLHR